MPSAHSRASRSENVAAAKICLLPLQVIVLSEQVVSFAGVAGRVQSYEINDSEMVAQIFPRWNPLTSWMRQIEDFQRAA